MNKWLGRGLAFLLLLLLLFPMTALGASQKQGYTQGEYVYNQSGQDYDPSSFSMVTSVIGNSKLAQSYQIALVLTPQSGFPLEEMGVFPDFFSEEGEERDGLLFVLDGERVDYIQPFGLAREFVTRDVAQEALDAAAVTLETGDSRDAILAAYEVVDDAFLNSSLSEESPIWAAAQEPPAWVDTLPARGSKGSPPKEYAGLTDDRVAKGHWDGIPIVDNSYKVHDFGDLLTDAQEQELEEKVRQLSKEYGTDFMLVFTNNTAGRSDQDFMWDFYEANAYGVGKKTDGVMFLLNLKNRRFEVSVHGRDIQTFSLKDLDHILDEIGYSLAADDTDALGAANVFLSQSSQVLELKSSRFAKGLGLGALVSAGLAGLVLSVLRLVHKRTLSGGINPQYYVEKDRLAVTHQSDRFVRTYTARTRRSTDSGGGGGGGGSSRGSSSSGSSFSGGGRSF